MTPRPVEEVVKELDAAKEELQEFRAVLSAAQKDEISAINRVNALQKELDACFSALKASAPRGTDWARPKGCPA